MTETADATPTTAAQRDLAVWVARIAWFTLPLTLGPGLVERFDHLSDGSQLGATIALWIFWAVGVVASAVALPISLTVIRIMTLGAVIAAVWALFGAPLGGLDVLGLTAAVVAAAAAFSALFGDRFVDGASYGDERRMLLRAPLGLASVAAPLAAGATLAGLVAGPLLLVHKRWLLGIIAVVVGVLLVLAGLRALHQLSRRWIVFVPTGFVLHDLSVLTEPVLFRRTAVERLGPAIAGTPARDLSLAAPGLVLECELTDPAPIGLRTGSAKAEQGDVRRFLFVPSRPGALLDEAERRRLPVG